MGDSSELHAETSITLLTDSGIDFGRHRAHGIPQAIFAEYLTTSGIRSPPDLAVGLVLNREVTWVCFHGMFDFAYLLRLLTNVPLPRSSSQFLCQLEEYFNKFYDLKCLAYPQEHMRGGLAKLEQVLNLSRLGTKHQAGSDSYVTALGFFKLMREYYLGQKRSIAEFRNELFGVDEDAPAAGEEAWAPEAGLPQATGYARTQAYYGQYAPMTAPFAYRTYSPGIPHCVSPLSN